MPPEDRCSGINPRYNIKKLCMCCEDCSYLYDDWNIDKNQIWRAEGKYFYYLGMPSESPW